jgi:hypothetical protein
MNIRVLSFTEQENCFDTIAAPNNPVWCQIRTAFNPCFSKPPYCCTFTKQEVQILNHIFEGCCADHTLQTVHCNVYACHAILYIGCNRVGLHHRVASFSTGLSQLTNATVMKRWWQIGTVIMEACLALIPLCSPRCVQAVLQPICFGFRPRLKNRVMQWFSNILPLRPIDKSKYSQPPPPPPVF